MGEPKLGSNAMHRPKDESRAPLARPASRFILGTNFSYPRPDGHPIRHEPTNSRSSVNSNGSLPGMTDSSDSEASADDDYHYNASASELWDSFWPTRTEKGQRAPKAQSSSTSQETQDRLSPDCYPAARVEGLEEGAVTVTQSDQVKLVAKASQWPLPKPSPPRPNLRPARGAVSYSVYPKPTPLPTRITALPTRKSSLSPEPVLRPLKGSKSTAQLKTKTLVPTLQLIPPPPTSGTTTQTQAPSVPVALRAPPNKLRASVSAYNMREKSQQNATTLLSQVPVPPIPDQLRSAPPQIEHFVSVFEFDSDNEQDNDTFAKRIARGLQHKKSLRDLSSRKSEHHKGHKKSVSEKSTFGLEKKADAFFDGTASLGRKRGGSFGRMLGFKSSK